MKNRFLLPAVVLSLGSYIWFCVRDKELLAHLESLMKSHVKNANWCPCETPDKTRKRKNHESYLEAESIQDFAQKVLQ